MNTVTKNQQINNHQMMEILKNQPNLQTANKNIDNFSNNSKNNQPNNSFVNNNLNGNQYNSYNSYQQMLNDNWRDRKFYKNKSSYFFKSKKPNNALEIPIEFEISYNNLNNTHDHNKDPETLESFKSYISI